MELGLRVYMRGMASVALVLRYESGFTDGD